MRESLQPKTWNGVPIPYDASILVLRKMISSSGPQAWAAMKALAVKPDKDSLDVLIECTQSEDPYLRRSAVEAIGKHSSGKIAVDIICHLLDDRNSFVIRSACDAAAELRIEDAHGRIHDLITDDETFTRFTALRALATLWESSDFDPVFERYLNDSSIEVRKQAAWTLSTNIESTHWKQVFERWSQDSIPRHRTWACQIAEKYGDKSILSTMERLTVDPDGHVRKAAQSALEKLKPS